MREGSFIFTHGLVDHDREKDNELEALITASCTSAHGDTVCDCVNDEACDAGKGCPKASLSCNRAIAVNGSCGGLSRMTSTVERWIPQQRRRRTLQVVIRSHELWT